ncbi:hypothetical protein [Amycolatopsis sacchari]|uniref:hypothetical protein n=1 Tax=Amycolatopsis sacchari TaxID=115433 RepID=UPI003EBAE24E
MDGPDEEALRLARQRGLGEKVFTEAFMDGGYACGLVFVPFVLLAAGIGLVVGAGGWTGRGIGIGLLVLAPVAVFLLWRLYDRAWRSAPKLYCFEGGVVFTSGGRPQVHPWRELDVRQYTRTRTIGQAQTQKQFAYVDLVVAATGEKLCTLGERVNLVKVLELASRER